MSACYALTAAEKPCRNYASSRGEEGERERERPHTCRHHAIYFTTKTLDEWKPWFWNLERAHNSIRRNHIESALRAGLLIVTREFVASLRVRRSYTYFLLLCARWQRGFSYSWNEPLYELSVKQLWIWSSAIGPVAITLNDIHTMIQESPTKLFYVVLALYPHEDTYIYSAFQWSLFFQSCKQKEWFDSLYHYENHAAKIQGIIEYLDKKNYNRVFLEFLRDGEFTRWFAKSKALYYIELTGGLLQELKHEILGYSWMPERMYDWCLTMDERERLVAWSSKPCKN